MKKRLAVLNERWAREGRPQLKIGIGINTGYAVAGNMGSMTVGDSEQQIFGQLSNGIHHADLVMMHSPKLSSCFDQLMKKTLATTMPAGVKIASSSIKITPGSAGGPANVVATGTGTIEVSVNGQQVPFYVSVAYITGPLIEAEVDTFNAGAPVSASVVNRLVATVATRASKGV